MYNTFNIFLASNDAASMLNFLESKNLEFTINLPQRYGLGKWKVCLKSMIIPNSIYNLYNNQKLSFTFTMHVAGYKFPKACCQNIIPGYYEVEDILEQIQQYIHDLGGPMILKYDLVRKMVKMKKRELYSNEI